MKKYQITFIFIFLFFFLVNLYFDLNKTARVREVHLTDFNRSVIDLKKSLNIPKSKIYPNNFKLWDMKVSKIIKSKEEEKIKKDKKNLQKKKKEQNIKIKYREICIENECWQLTGIMSINNIKNLILLKKDKKPKVEIFQIGDELLPKISIIDIRGDSMILLNKEKDKKIILKLFDINVSKYKPKTTKDKNE